MYNKAVAKPPYYKQTQKTLTQLMENCMRISMDVRMGNVTKKQNIFNMFKSYMENSTDQCYFLLDILDSVCYIKL